MYDGTIKAIENILPGDFLMGDDSTARRVLSTTKGQGKMFTIVPAFGDSYCVNDIHVLSLKCAYSPKKICFEAKTERFRVTWLQDHLLKTKSFNMSNYGSKEEARKAANRFLDGVPTTKVGDVLDIALNLYLGMPKQWKVCYKGYAVEVNFSNNKELPVDPYLVGLWLGDGDSTSPRITNDDKEIIDYLKITAEKMGIETKRVSKTITYSLTTGKPNGKNLFLTFLKEHNLISNKHIPHDYKTSSRENRLKLLAGLIDSDGYFSRNAYYELTLKSEKLADDIIFLARSLGFRSYKTKTEKTCTNSSTGPKRGTYFRFGISGSRLGDIPCLLPHKKANNKATRNELLTGFTVEEAGFDEFYGFTLDGNGRYLHSDFVVTHNTTELLRRIRRYTVAKRKCLVVKYKQDTRYSQESLATHDRYVNVIVALTEAGCGLGDTNSSLAY